MTDPKEGTSQNTGQEANPNAIANYYANLIVQEWNNVAGWYENSARMIITYPLLINASAAIALASLITRNNLALYLKLAILSFICGTIFGIVTLILEYLTPYIALKNYKDHFFKDYKNDPVVLKQKCDSYFPNKDKRIAETILIRLFNGTLAILCCLIGIFCIINDIIDRHEYIITAISILFVCYACCLMYRVTHTLKPKSTNQHSSAPKNE